MSNAALANPTVRKLWTYALFASHLQPSDRPTGEQVRTTIAAVLRRRGSCAATVAFEYGRHPDTAASRMVWCCECVAAAIAENTGAS